MHACLKGQFKKEKKQPSHQSVLPKQKDNPWVCHSSCRIATAASQVLSDPHTCSAGTAPSPYLLPAACLSVVPYCAQSFGEPRHLQSLCWHPAHSITSPYSNTAWKSTQGAPKAFLNSSHVILEQLSCSLSLLWLTQEKTMWHIRLLAEKAAVGSPLCLK